MTATSSDQTTAAPARPKRNWASIAVWAAQILLALILIFGASLPKLAGQHMTVHMFAKIGWGQWLRYFTACCELAGGVGLLIPRLASVAAIGLVGLMVGAIAFQLFVLGAAGAVTPVVFLVLFVLIAKVRWPERWSVLRR